MFGLTANLGSGSEAVIRLFWNFGNMWLPLFLFYSLLGPLFMNMVRAMPYNVPLQGLKGGKRTLVLLDDMVSLIVFSLDYFLLLFRFMSTHGHPIFCTVTDKNADTLFVFGWSF